MFKKILEEFNVQNVIECVPFGSGHINSTYKVVCENKKYILQKINTVAFKEPEKIMFNIGKVSEHLKTKVDNKNQILNFLKAKSGEFYHIDENGDFWRAYEYIDSCSGVDSPTDEEFYECAKAFGNFQSMLSDFDAKVLYETIPDFHNTPKRYENFCLAVKEDVCDRVKNVKKEIEFVHKYKPFYDVLINANKQGVLPTRVSHNDTKSNNVLLDDKTKRAVCVIDLDTIMPGFSVTDFGDAIRFGANTASEDEKDLSKVKFDKSKFEIFAKGFIKGCDNKLELDEILLMPEGAKMMTLECGMRFLTDYLQGDVYFRTAYPEHNLVRCRTQFKLVEEMDKNWDKMKEIVKKYC
ncbi:MAG: aminoglycoside phosphotransferase family protein [Clostridia bacterium]|nr:aminoglycoside phosphotransferase family protein [Clostridia bacterium]